MLAPVSVSGMFLTNEEFLATRTPSSCYAVTRDRFFFTKVSGRRSYSVPLFFFESSLSTSAACRLLSQLTALCTTYCLRVSLSQIALSCQTVLLLEQSSFHCEVKSGSSRVACSVLPVILVLQLYTHFLHGAQKPFDFCSWSFWSYRSVFEAKVVSR